MGKMTSTRGIGMVIAVLLIGWMAAMALTDSRATADTSDCDPAMMADRAQYPSPDERYTATNFGVLDVQANRCEIIARGIASEFFAWTGDGRYAVINSADQYGNVFGVVFDTKKWLEVRVAYRPDASTCGMSSRCSHGARAIAPILKRVLFADGALLYLSDNQQHTLLADSPDYQIGAAGFSPGEQYLVYVRYRLSDPSHAGDDYAVYAANGDGSEPRLLLEFTPQPTDAITIEWYTDGTPKFTLTVGAVQTLINVWTGEINP